MVIVWLLCIILTSAGVLSSTKEGFGYYARTDTKTNVIYEAPWIRMPYPGEKIDRSTSFSSVLQFNGTAYPSCYHKLHNFSIPIFFSCSINPADKHKTHQDQLVVCPKIC